MMKWADGAYYDGEWSQGFASGQGTFYHVNGDKYEGTWHNNKCNGFGIYTSAKGARYEGEWKDDKQSGKGKEFWPQDGSVYVGEF